MTADSSVMSAGDRPPVLRRRRRRSRSRRQAARRDDRRREPGVADPVTRGDEPSAPTPSRLQYDDVDVRLDSSIALERRSPTAARCAAASATSRPGATGRRDRRHGPGGLRALRRVGQLRLPGRALFVTALAATTASRPLPRWTAARSARWSRVSRSSTSLARRAWRGCIARRDQGAYESACPPPVVDGLPPVVTPPVVLADTLRPAHQPRVADAPRVQGGRRDGAPLLPIRSGPVRIVVERRLRGRRVGRRCLAPTTRRLRRPRCVRWKRATLLTRSLPAGRAQVRSAAARCESGRYRFSITATDAAGNTTARPVRLAFRVLRRIKS